VRPEGPRTNSTIVTKSGANEKAKRARIERRELELRSLNMEYRQIECFLTTVRLTRIKVSVFNTDFQQSACMWSRSIVYADECRR
jgi:hypothetical protein